jgi:exosome complex component RRP41
MRDLVCSVAAGKADGTVMLDLFQPEDNFGEADLPVAMMPNSEGITLIQMDGDLTKKEFDESMKLVTEAMPILYELQKKGLINGEASFEGGKVK